MDEEPAPFFTIPEREVFALEHPMVIRNLDKAIQTFGRNRPFLRVCFLSFLDAVSHLGRNLMAFDIIM